MRTASLLVTALLWVAVAASAWSQSPGTTLSVRVVTTSPEGEGPDARLNDIMPLLRSTLPGRAFRLEGESSLTFRDGSEATLARGYRLALSQVQGSSAMVRMTQKETKVLETRLAMREDKPVLYCFDDAGGGKVIIILKLR